MSAPGQGPRRAGLVEEPADVRPAEVRARPVAAHLDLLRALAALAVFAGHLRMIFFVGWDPTMRASLLARIMYFSTGFSHEAVILFFVLSGYLVGGAVIRGQRQGTWAWGPYLVARLTRLWLVLLPALALGALLDLVNGARLALPPEAFTAATAAGNALFLQGGILVPEFGSNGALWSLSYEFWYYIAFPPLIAALMGNPRKRWLNAALAAAVLLAVGWQVALRFPLWLVGAAAAALPPLRWARWLAGAAAVALAATLVHVETTPGLRPSFAAEAVVAVLVAALIAGLQHDERPVPARYARAARWAAGCSYSLYLVHCPAVFLLAHLCLGPAGRWYPSLRTAALALPLAVLVLGYAVLVARLTERHTDAARRALLRRLRLDPAASRDPS